MTTQNTPNLDHIDVFFEQWARAWNTHDPAHISEFFTEDGVWDDPVFDDSVVGRRSIEQNLEVVFNAIPDLELEVLGIYISRDRRSAADRFRLTGTVTGPLDPPGYAPTNQPVTVEGAAFFEFNADLISHCTVVTDMLDLARQIGAAPKQGSVGHRASILLQKAAARRIRRQTTHR